MHKKSGHFIHVLIFQQRVLLYTTKHSKLQLLLISAPKYIKFTANNWIFWIKKLFDLHSAYLNVSDERKMCACGIIIEKDMRLPLFS